MNEAFSELNKSSYTILKVREVVRLVPGVLGLTSYVFCKDAFILVKWLDYRWRFFDPRNPSFFNKGLERIKYRDVQDFEFDGVEIVCSEKTRLKANQEFIMAYPEFFL